MIPPFGADLYSNGAKKRKGAEFFSAPLRFFAPFE
jgi:hypothetical protein